MVGTDPKFKLQLNVAKLNHIEGGTEGRCISERVSNEEKYRTKGQSRTISQAQDHPPDNDALH